MKMDFDSDIILFITDHQTGSICPHNGPSTTTVTIRENDCELKNGCLADTTGTIILSLWDSQIDQVLVEKTYTFTNLSTRKFNDKLHAQVYHNSTTKR